MTNYELTSTGNKKLFLANNIDQLFINNFTLEKCYLI